MNVLTLLAVVFLTEAVVFSPAVYFAAQQQRWWIVAGLLVGWLVASSHTKVKGG